MHSKPRILAVIPARRGSIGIPRKNMKLLGGRPLIDYTIQAAKQSGLLTKIVVSTDCVHTALHAATFKNVEVPFLRPAEISSDYATSVQVVQHALQFFHKRQYDFDMVMLLQPTCPFREVGLIDRCIERFMLSSADSLVTARRIPYQHSPYWAFRERDDGFLEQFCGGKLVSRRQDLPEVFCRDGQMYLSKKIVIEQGSLIGDRLAYLECDHAFNVNIDGPDDWAKAEQLVENWQINLKRKLSYC